MAIVVRHINTASRPLVEGTVLHAAVEATISRTPTMLVVRVPRLPADEGQHLTEMLSAAHVGDYPFVLLAEAGQHLVHVGSRRLVDNRLPHVAPDHAAAVRGHGSRVDLSFSPAQRWVMRALLLAPLAGRGWWPGPPGPWRSAQDVARAGSMSLATATRTVNALITRGWVAKARRGITVIDPEGMLRACADHARLQRYSGCPVTVAYGGPDDRTPRALVIWFREALQKDSHHIDGGAMAVALTGWHALAEHRMAISSGLSSKRPQVALVGELSAILALCHLVPATPAQADMDLFPDQEARDVPAGPKQGLVDPVQAMLCVAADPENGAEQVAEVIGQIADASRSAQI